ncbi:unnamed protein product [Staurois parvus]|uniref:Uncharacterized protein n=1 Tax=Staurois parvus TaxID=386267 RepID=A0ABN9CP29_9NEOB|nr:unnamed protein product [Staurois parvus]
MKERLPFFIHLQKALKSVTKPRTLHSLYLVSHSPQNMQLF